MNVRKLWQPRSRGAREKRNSCSCLIWGAPCESPTGRGGGSGWFIRQIIPQFYFIPFHFLFIASNVIISFYGFYIFYFFLYILISFLSFFFFNI